MYRPSLYNITDIKNLYILIQNILNKKVLNMKVFVKIFLINLMTITTIIYGTKDPATDALNVHVSHNKNELHAELIKILF